MTDKPSIAARLAECERILQSPMYGADTNNVTFGMRMVALPAVAKVADELAAIRAVRGALATECREAVAACPQQDDDLSVYGMCEGGGLSPNWRPRCRQTLARSCGRWLRRFRTQVGRIALNGTPASTIAERLAALEARMRGEYEKNRVDGGYYTIAWADELAACVRQAELIADSIGIDLMELAKLQPALPNDGSRIPLVMAIHRIEKELKRLAGAPEDSDG